MQLFLEKWASVVGLALDIIGALLVYRGVHITVAKASALEQLELAKLIDDISSDEIIARNERLVNDRANERLRARNWAGFGLVCFIVGFALQTIGNWPKQAHTIKADGANTSPSVLFLRLATSIDIREPVNK
jgi:hypothetical protein